MADELDLNGNPTGDKPTVTPPAPPVYDDQEIQILRQKAAAYDNLDGRLSPYVDDIKDIVDDEEFRNFYRQTRDSYKEAKQRATANQISPELAPLAKKLDRLDAFVSTLETREKEAAKASEAEYIRVQQEYARKLKADHNLDNDDIEALAAVAIQKKTNLEGAWNFMNSKFKISPIKEDAPPRSLRASEAIPGVPGRSSEPPVSDRDTFLARLRKNAKRAMSGG
jgi:hypothetical protein